MVLKSGVYCTDLFFYTWWPVLSVCRFVCVVVQSLSCVRLFFDPMNCNLPGSSVHGIFKERILEWVAISLLQRLFPTQGSNLHRLHWQADSLPSEPPEKLCVYVYIHTHIHTLTPAPPHTIFQTTALSQAADPHIISTIPQTCSSADTVHTAQCTTSFLSLTCVCVFVCVCESLSCVQSHGLQSASLLERVAIPFSRGIFLTQGLNLGLQHCRQILYHLSHQGKQD